jgi:hypothetical protein
MSERGTKLWERANGQIAEVMCLVAGSGEAALLLPNPARRKLGDGTVGASALHTADGYRRIARMIRTSSPRPGDEGHSDDGNTERGYGHDDYRRENVDLQVVIDRLSAGRSALSLLSDLTDDRLDSVLPAGSARFSDGKRTLEQVVRAALNHQQRNVDALKAAVA